LLPGEGDKLRSSPPWTNIVTSKPIPSFPGNAKLLSTRIQIIFGIIRHKAPGLPFAAMTPIASHSFIAHGNICYRLVVLMASNNLASVAGRNRINAWSSGKAGQLAAGSQLVARCLDPQDPPAGLRG
jgi:hypothetical protein